MQKLLQKMIEKHNDSVLTSKFIENEITFISETLEIMRDSNEISNDAYLELGSIQGGLSVISSLILQNVEYAEISLLLNTLEERSILLEKKYQDLSNKFEEHRK